jgi:hypothetical protein
MKKVYRKIKPDNLQSLVGQKFGRLLVTEVCERRMVLASSKRPAYRGPEQLKVQCECGEIQVADWFKMVKGQKKSCGCLARDWGKTLAERFVKKAPTLAAKRAIFLVHAYSAKTRNILNHLTEDQVWELSQKPCHYCGSEPSNVKRRKLAHGLTDEVKYSGIDRLDSQLDYTKENTVTSCRTCNLMKGWTLSRKSFIDHVKRIAHHCSYSA